MTFQQLWDTLVSKKPALNASALVGDGEKGVLLEMSVAGFKKMLSQAYYAGAKEERRCAAAKPPGDFRDSKDIGDFFSELFTKRDDGGKK